MVNITQNLQRYFESFIENKEIFPFYKGLADYLDYVFSVPQLKNVFADEFGERNAEYQKLYELEEKSIQELKKVKSKLLSVIKKKKVDVAKFTRYATMVFPRDDMTMVDELEAYINKDGVWGGRPLSDTVEDYLFDIGANLLGVGYEKEMVEFLAKPEDYQQYEINRNIHITVQGRQESFIFSRTLWERRYMNKVIERGRALKSWGSFEKLYQFRLAYQHSMNAKDPMVNFHSMDAGEYGIPDVDLVETTHMQADLDNLIKKHKPFAQNISREPERHLMLQDFVPVAKSVHNILMKIGSEAESVKEERVKKVSEKPSNLALIEYNVTTGMGSNGDIKFKFKDGSEEYLIFKLLYSKINKKIERQDVLIAAGFYQDYEKPDPTRKTSETACINEIVKTMREKTELDTDQLVNNGGNLTLVGRKN